MTISYPTIPSYTIISYYGNTVSTSTPVYTGNLTTGTYISPELSFNTLYNFKVTPYNSAGISGKERIITIDTTPYVAGVYASNSTNSNAQIQWYGTYSYVKIYRRISAPFLTAYVDVSSGTNFSTIPYYDRDLSGNTTYNYFVRPFDANDNAYTDSSAITVTTNAQAARDLSAVFFDASAIRIQFTAPKNSYSSTYYYQLNALYNGVTTSISGSSSPLLVNGLANGTTYSCYILSYLDGILRSTSVGLNIQTIKTYYNYSFSTIPTFDTTSGTFVSTAMSYDGKYIYAVGGTTTGYKSSNFGVSWTTMTFPRNTYIICCSWDGSIIYACGSTGGGPSTYIAKSTNYGTTITTLVDVNLIPSEFGTSSLCCSSDGKYIYLGGSGGGNFRWSYDFGVTWNGASSYDGRQRVACSSDGKYLVSSGPNNGSTYLNNSLYNYSGGSWTNIGYIASASLCCAAISDGGTYMIVPNGTTWYLSKNGGTSWAALPSPVNGSLATQGCAMSYTGQYMMVGYNGSLYYSKDYGVNWTLIAGSSAYIGTSNGMSQALTMAPSGAFAIVNNGSKTSYYLLTG